MRARYQNMCGELDKPDRIKTPWRLCVSVLPLQHRELSKEAMGTVKRSTTTKGGALRSSPIPMGSPDEPLPQRRHLERLHRKFAQMELDVSDSDDKKDRAADKATPPSGSIKKQDERNRHDGLFSVPIKGSAVSAYHAQPRYVA